MTAKLHSQMGNVAQNYVLDTTYESKSVAVLAEKINENSTVKAETVSYTDNGDGTSKTETALSMSLAGFVGLRYTDESGKQMIVCNVNESHREVFTKMNHDKYSTVHKHGGDALPVEVFMARYGTQSFTLHEGTIV